MPLSTTLQIMPNTRSSKIAPPAVVLRWQSKRKNQTSVRPSNENRPIHLRQLGLPRRRNRNLRDRITITLNSAIVGSALRLHASRNTSAEIARIVWRRNIAIVVPASDEVGHGKIVGTIDAVVLPAVAMTTRIQTNLMNAIAVGSSNSIVRKPPRRHRTRGRPPERKRNPTNTNSGGIIRGSGFTRPTKTIDTTRRRRRKARNNAADREVGGRCGEVA